MNDRIAGANARGTEAHGDLLPLILLRLAQVCADEAELQEQLVKCSKHRDDWRAMHELLATRYLRTAGALRMLASEQED